MDSYDVIVAGVGGMGSAALMHLADRGKRVLGIEASTVPNSLGSSHGETRIIRLAYFEHSSYVPLLRRAYALWRQLEKRSGRNLLRITGGLDAGAPDSSVFTGSLASCRDHDLTHEVLTAADVSRRFPAYHLPAGHRAVFQPDAGYLLSEDCVETHAAMAVAAGADLRTGERLLGWERGAPGIRVHTDRGEYGAERMVVTTGAWTGSLLPALADVAVPERQVVGWFRPGRAELFAPARFPIFVNEVAGGTFYGFPIHRIPGFKLGRFHHRGEVANPDALDREIHPADEAILRAHVRECFPDADGEMVKATVCMFVNSPDEHFIIDLHPALPDVVIGAGFSGHGFKFCSVVGEILADLAIDGRSRQETGLFRAGRFGTAAAVL